LAGISSDAQIDEALARPPLHGRAAKSEGILRGALHDLDREIKRYATPGGGGGFDDLVPAELQRPQNVWRRIQDADAQSQHDHFLSHASRLALHLVQRFALRELVDQLVQVSRLLYERIRDFFHAHATDHALDERAVRMNARRLGEERLKVTLLFQLLL